MVAYHREEIKHNAQVKYEEIRIDDKFSQPISVQLIPATDPLFQNVRVGIVGRMSELVTSATQMGQRMFSHL